MRDGRRETGGGVEPGEIRETLKMTGRIAGLMLGGAMLAAGAAAAQDKVTVAYFLEWPTANQVAQVDKTYDKALGVEVEWRAFGTGTEMNQAMVSGDVDIAYSHGFVPFVVGVTNGAPLKLVGIAVTYSENDLCIVRDDAGITKDERQGARGQEGGDADRQRHPLQAPAHPRPSRASTPRRSRSCR